MTYVQALVLGLLQGLTEFLPVSSSGHLQAVPFLFGWDSANLTFDVLVHTGTLAAVVWHFRRDLWALATDALATGRSTESRRQAWLLIGLLAAGSVPAAAAGLAFADTFEAAFDSPRMVAGFLYLTAVLLWAAERLRRARARRLDATLGNPAPTHRAVVDDADTGGRGFTTLSVRDALAIGAAQALAIFPGVSRSGATIAAGMALGLSRIAAARFSFLLSIPVILGATIFTLPDVGEVDPGTLPFGGGEVVVGMVAAALSGYWAIRFLLALVVRRDLLGFARYVTLFGTVLLAATFVLD